MIKNFEYEANILENNLIDEKLMILTLYNEFYKAIMESPKVDDKFIIKYESFLQNVFRITYNHSHYKDNDINTAEKFMQHYLMLLQHNKTFYNGAGPEYIEYFKIKMSNYIESMPHVKVIDNFNTLSMPLRIILKSGFETFFRTIYGELIQLFITEKTEILKPELLEMLCKAMNQYLIENSSKVDLDELKITLTQHTKDYLINMVLYGDFQVYYLDDGDIRNIFNYLSEFEQKILSLVKMYRICGYKENNKETEKYMVNEICDLLGISNTRFKLITSTSMKFHAIKGIIKSYKDEMNTSTKDKKKIKKNEFNKK